MQSLVSDTYSAGRGVKRFASNFSAGFAGNMTSTANQVRNSFNGSLGLGLGATSRPFDADFKQDGAIPYGPPLQGSEDLNPVVTIFGRRYRAPGPANLANADLGPPGERNLAMVWRSRPKVENVYIPLSLEAPSNGLIASMFAGSTNSSYEPMSGVQGKGISVQGAPTLAMMPHQGNFMLAELQSGWTPFRGYEHVTAPILTYGGTMLPKEMYPDEWPSTKELKDLPGLTEYEGLSFDGVVTHIIGDDGSAPQYTDGLRMYGGQLSGRADSKTYTATVNNKGKTTTLDYCGGEAVLGGYHLYAVLKKWHIDQYDHPDDAHKNIFLFNLVTKGHDEFRDGAAMRRTVTMPKCVNGELARPLMWAFVMSQSVLDREYAKYVDEFGTERQGVIAHIGVIESAPIRGQLLPPPTPDSLRPYMNNKQTSRGDPLELIVNVDDGLKCMI